MSIFTTIMLCLCSAFIAIELAGHAFAPDQFPDIAWRQIAGWAVFAIAIIILDK